MIALALWLAAAASVPQDPVVVGSKKFTESVILGELATRLARDAGADAVHRRELGGTRVLWGALLAGDVDVYPDYSGTLYQEILAGEGVDDLEGLRAALAQRGIGASAPLGFDNTYVLGVRRDLAERLELRTISDLAAHPELALGFGNEFLDRGDGWPGLRARYALPHADVRGLDHDLAYRGLEAGSIQVMDLYATDAEIRYYDLVSLEDDRGYFPSYQALLLWRLDLERRAPEVVAALRRLEGRLDADAMVGLNARVKLGGESEAAVAASWLDGSLGVASTVDEEGAWSQLLRRTREHLFLTAISLAAAIALAVPLGILAARRPRLGQVVLGATGVIQTVPSLALFVFMIPLLGIGERPAIVALFLYSLLPIVRNTAAGLTDVPPAVRESAEALGLGSAARLRLVELPLASRAILAGIKTAAVINVGTATLGALIGSGGYGQPILTGIRLDDWNLIFLQGAGPAAVLALAVQGVFELAERAVVPRGLRLAPVSGGAGPE